MKFLLWAGASALLGYASSLQSASSLLERHVANLRDAKTLRFVVSVQPIGGASSEATVTMAKPNKLSVQGQGWQVHATGTEVFDYTKSSNTYEQNPWSEAAGRKLGGRPELWAWATFFDANQLQGATATLGAKRKIKGVDVVELKLVTKSEPKTEGTLYIEPKSGIAMGALMSPRIPGGAEVLVVGRDFVLNGEVSEDLFAFVPPADAKKHDPNAVPAGDTITYSQIHAVWSAQCMPCHGSNASGGLNLTSYESLMASNTIVAGNPDASRIVLYIEGKMQPRMPKNRQAMPTKDIQLVRAWIAAGAKKS